MRMDLWYCDTDRGKMNYPDKNLSNATVSTINIAMTVRCDERYVTKHITGSYVYWTVHHLDSCIDTPT